MLATLDILLDQPLVLFLVLAVGAAIGIGIEKYFTVIEREKRKAFWRARNGGRGKLTPSGKGLRPISERALMDATQQMRCVMKAHFRPRPLLNKPEGQVFKALDKIVIARNPKWQVMAQVSLGEFLASEDKDAYSCINSKRVDFALMDTQCRVRHALEYQGSGHHQGAAAARDAVKKEALRKAGVGYHEIVAGHTTPADLRALVEKLVPPEVAVGKAA